jgi:restriction endonuclease S subunit
MCQLGQIAKLEPGYSFRSRVESDPSGTMLVVQMKDIDESGELDISGLSRVQLDEVKPRYLLKNGDILFRSRSTTNAATVVPDHLGVAIAAAPIIMIRLRAEIADPNCVAWFLNHPKTQQRLQRQAKGTSLMMIDRHSLGELEIPLPSLEVQHQIAELARLQQRERQLVRELEQKRHDYFNTILMQTMEQG